MSRQNRETTPRTDAGGGIAQGHYPALAREALIEMILSWGAAADPDRADLLGALSGFDEEILGLLRTLRQKGRAFLPVPLWEQIDGAARRLPEAGSVRLDETLAQARRELASFIEQRRATILSELKGWAAHMDFIQMTTLLDRIWRTERAMTVADRLAAAEGLLEAHGMLEEVRRSFAGRLEGLLGQASGAPAPPDLDRQTRAAIEKGEPREMSRALAALRDLGSSQNQRRAEESLRQARAKLEATCARARSDQGAGSSATAVSPSPLHAEALRQAEQTLQATASAAAAGQMESWAGVLACWDQALCALLDGRSGSGEEAQKARQALADGLRGDIARHMALDLGLPDKGAKLPTGDLDGTAKNLLDVAISGGGSFQQAFDNALALARKVRTRSEARLRETSSRLRAAAAEMTSFLDKAAGQLPTARVVQARLWLDQVEGIIASSEIPSMASMTRMLTDDLRELERLMELVMKRKHNRAAGELENLKAEADRLLKASSGAMAARIKALAGQAEKADAKALASLREQLDKLAVEVEQAVRLEAGRALYAGERLLPRGGKRAGAVPARLREIDDLVDPLRAAMEKDNLAILVSLSRELRSAVSSTSPMSRRPIRIALAAAGVVAVAGGLFAWRHFAHPGGQQTFRLKLTATARQSAIVQLAREGKFVEGPRQMKGNDTVEFTLEPGRYEIFVNDKDTGRVIQVPGSEEVIEVPIP